MGQLLARRTAAHLRTLAADCERIQGAVGDLIACDASDRTQRRPAGLAEQTLHDLQGLDRIGQLLRDLADVQHALSMSDGNDGAEMAAARAVETARLQETRMALAAGSSDGETPEPRPARRDGGADDCELL